jgi:hypothetical protein
MGRLVRVGASMRKADAAAEAEAGQTLNPKLKHKRKQKQKQAVARGSVKKEMELKQELTRETESLLMRLAEAGVEAEVAEQHMKKEMELNLELTRETESSLMRLARVEAEVEAEVEEQHIVAEGWPALLDVSPGEWQAEVQAEADEAADDDAWEQRMTLCAWHKLRTQAYAAEQRRLGRCPWPVEP